MDKILPSLQLYLLQQDSVYALILKCVFIIAILVTTIPMVKIVHHYFEHEGWYNPYCTYITLNILTLIIAMYGLPKVTYAKELEQIVSIQSIIQQTDIEEEATYYSLHFNPKEPIVFDDAGKVIRLNGNEELIPISEEIAQSTNYIKVKQVKVLLDNDLTTNLNNSLKDKSVKISNPYLFKMKIVETKYNGAGN